MPVAVTAPVTPSSASSAASEPITETFALYLAKQLMARKGLRPGVPPEAGAIATASDMVLSGSDGLNFRIVAIIDRDAHPGKQFDLGRDLLEAIGSDCLKYSGTMRRAKMPVTIQVFEVGGGTPSSEQIARLRELKQASFFGKVVLSGWIVDPSGSSVWTNAPFNGRWLGRPFIENLLRSPRVDVKDIEPAPPIREPVVPLLTYAMLAIMLCAYACELIFPVSPPKGIDISIQTLIAQGGLSRTLVVAGQWYRLLSAALLHLNPLHLLMNGVCLFLAGRVLETLVGRSWFALIFIVGALGGSIASLALNPPNVMSVGASGAIMALFAAIYILSFHYDGGAVRTQLQMRALNVLVPSLIPLGTSIGSGHVDFGAHLGGAIVGAALGLLLLRAWPRVELLPRFRAGAAVIATIGALAFALTLLPITQNYRAFARVADLIPADQMPKTDAEVPGRSADLLARYPGDPRAHVFRAVYLLQIRDWAAAEGELRSALAQGEVIRFYLSREFEMQTRGLLATALFSQAKTVEAKAEAKPACASSDTPQRVRGALAGLHLCD